MNELTKVEQTLLKLLMQGYSQSEVAQYFKEHDEFKINTIASVEKIIQKLKKRFGIKTLFQMGMIAEKIIK